MPLAGEQLLRLGGAGEAKDGVEAALDTAAGDLTATAGFGYLGSVVLFAAAIRVPVLAHRFGVLAAVPAFWTAYVTTRPLSASLADWMALGHARGGLGFGLGPVAIACFVGYLAVSRKDTSYGK
ncbi:hypothetical protein [Streptomyces griseofuscus]|uniref:hypothetical protein n=1 Tax=Streptomyces griseofuscus TaxID=146922 RepID=UPI0034463676